MNTQASAWSVSGDPQGSWLTLLHPIGSDRQIWAGLLPALAPHHRLLTLDLRGHGEAVPADTPLGLDDLAADCERLWDQLGVVRSHVLGLSLGGCVGLALARRAPGRVHSLSMACARLDMDDAAARLWHDRAAQVRAQGMDAVVPATLARWFTEPFRSTQPAQVQRVAETLRNTSAEGFAHCALALAHGQPAQAWAELQLPTLYIAGRHDQAVPSAHLKRYHACTPGAEWAELDGPHLLHLENPQGFASTVLDFLRRCET